LGIGTTTIFRTGNEAVARIAVAGLAARTVGADFLRNQAAIWHGRLVTVCHWYLETLVYYFVLVTNSFTDFDILGNGRVPTRHFAVRDIKAFFLVDSFGSAIGQINPDDVSLCLELHVKLRLNVFVTFGHLLGDAIVTSLLDSLGLRVPVGNVTWR